ncbi:hypothetical protein COV05_04620 [Candidatus Uhrbacteria bacterium CG10_big_fil_rev_8_21_14_0_10_48_16]|uniref:DUF3307 domain-containing protein n=1 Tax=Candidatus Uhrbacteria bacterium CG10_big_fil_rev_8_21_14_0_10_48_16 TaxID=1975038 RepID=A0A2M8LG33_9BACT|nr:MAG: hypothetical protein COV05_04620 [Candidatus Uhrbacteria bacterium CG10_big_fil_rev_8_21_14_0_10_48_16]
MSLALPLVRFFIYWALHMIGDFAFQSVWMISEKGKSWEVLIYHCLTYTAPFVVCLLHPDLTEHVTPQGLALIFISHIFIDAAKSRWGWIKRIWVDQLWHLSMIALAIALGWM